MSKDKLVKITEDGELLEVPNQLVVNADPFEEVASGIFSIIGEPRQWRSDMSSNGGYKIGEGRPQDTIDMEVLHWEDMPQTQLFSEKYATTNWGCIYFVDSNNQFSTMLIKGRTRENFIETVRAIMSAGLTIGRVVIKGSTAPKVGKDKEGKDAPYRVGTFEFKENKPEKIQALKEFWVANENGKLLYSNFINEIKGKAPILLGVPQQPLQLTETE